MGPSNIALVKLYEADSDLREAQSRLDAATRDVRIQGRKVQDLTQRQQKASETHKALQTQYGLIDLDIKSREAHIEKLRVAQQNTHNNREYQSLLMEISTRKVDKTKAEEQGFKLLEQVDKAQTELRDTTALLEAEAQKLAAAEAQINDKVVEIRAEVEAKRPARDEAAKGVNRQQLEIFERLAERYDGEAMSALTRPDKRHEEYSCSACNMDVVVDLYNRLHNRDEQIFCPSCRRLLFIPQDLPPELAIGIKTEKKAAPASKTRRKTKAEKQNVGKVSTGPVLSKWDEVVTAAQGESNRAAHEADHAPVMCDVTINGEAVGHFKGKTADHLERCIKLLMSERGFDVAIQVTPVGAPEAAGIETDAPNAAAAEVGTDTLSG